MRLTDALIEQEYKLKDDGCIDGLIIKGVTCDSRQVKPGYLFAAFQGTNENGCTFVSEAIFKGAAAIILEKNLAKTLNCKEVPIITVSNSRKAYAVISSNVYKPSPKTIVAITGTNGKTSSASFLRQIWSGLGVPSCSGGTLGLELAGPNLNKNKNLISKSNLTTPDSADLHRYLQQLSIHNINNVVLEASSHGLAQYRLDGLQISAAAFTNLSRDHLDYHGDFKKYMAAKRRLFTELLVKKGLAVVNNDDPFSMNLISDLQKDCHKILSYGFRGDEIKIVSVEPEANGQLLVVEVFGARYEARVPLVGAFQISNIMCALTLAIGLGSDTEEAINQLSKLKGVPGRIERVGETSAGATIYVDYAHSPDSLAALLKALRIYTKKNLYLVFGCGGDRDSGKRKQMGEIADRYADRVVITDDNPRFEDPNKIREEIKFGCPSGEEIGNREEAIRFAIRNLCKGDTLVIAGKGHENSQIIGETMLKFSDNGVVRKILKEDVNA